MKICLDTNAYSDWRRTGRWNFLIEIAQEVIFPVVVLGELKVGFHAGGQKITNEESLRAILANRAERVAPVGQETANFYADLYHHLRRHSTPIPINDVWIAACCIESGATLLTRDRHLEHLPQLRVRWPED